MADRKARKAGRPAAAPRTPADDRPVAARDADLMGEGHEPSQAPSALPDGARAPQAAREQPRLLESFAVSLTWAACAFALAAIVGAAVPQARTIGLGVALVGVLLFLASLACSLPIDTLRHLRASVTGGTVYDRMRGARSLRFTAMLLQFLTLVGWVGIGLRVLWRLGVGPSLDSPIVDRGFLVLVAALGAVAAIAHLQSLRTPLTRDRSTPTWVVFGLGVAAALACLAIGVAVLLGARPAVGPVDWELDDASIVAVAAYTFLAVAMRRSRGLPSTASLLADTNASDTAVAHQGRTKAVLIPTILAFALLLVVFLLILLFGIGIGDILSTVGSSPLLLGALVFLVVALLGSLGLALLLSRSAEKDAPLYARLPDRKQRQVRWILATSGVAAGTMALLATAAFQGYLPRFLGLHLVCLALLTALGPYGFYIAREWNRIRRLEERFPDFLRDIASSHKGGLTLHQSVTIAARGEYGPLTPEVRKMADQLSWNVSFHEALERFGARVETPLVQRAVNLILQADRSGGSTTDVLLAAARDAREIKNLENERRQTMSLYTIVVYITFFVFLSVAATLYGQFAPAIVESTRAVQGSTLQANDLGQSTLSLADYQLFYFVAAIVQAVGDGVVGGLLGSGRASLGLRHAFIMVLATYVTFILLL